MRKFKSICLLILALFALANSVFAKNECSTGKFNASGPYCGLYCLYSTMKLFDREIDIQDLLKPEYIGSRKGSSLAELKKAAKDNNINAQAAGNLSSRELKKITDPVILHVKSSPQNKTYDHYILFLGDNNGKAQIFDPPHPVDIIPYYKLAPIWDGSGLIVSPEPINLAKVFAPARKQFIIFAGMVIGIIAVIRFLRKYITGWIGDIRRKYLFGLSFLQGTGLTAVALLAGLIFHFVSETGFLAHLGATQPVVKANFASFTPKVTAKDIEKVNRSGGAVIIDARQTLDYQAGHIDGAINIPPALCTAGRSAKLAKVKKNNQLIIYCQDRGCPYAERVAENLKEDGFNNIAIYKGGWNEWKAKEHKGEH